MSNAQLSELYASIRDFDIDGEPVRFGFADRLAQENGWTLEFARRAIVEYKRFVYLAMAAGHPCTPSQNVDKVWHLHLCYTTSYWERFVPTVLPRPLHHNPTKGGRAEDAKHDALYKRTLDSYATAFREAPPSDIWSPTQQQSSPATSLRQVDVSENWVISKSRARSWMGLCFGLLTAVALVAGCIPLIGQLQPVPDGSDVFAMFLVIVVVLIGVGVLIALLTRNRAAQKGGTSTRTPDGSHDTSTSFPMFDSITPIHQPSVDGTVQHGAHTGHSAPDGTGTEGHGHSGGHDSGSHGTSHGHDGGSGHDAGGGGHDASAGDSGASSCSSSSCSGGGCSSG